VPDDFGSPLIKEITAGNFGNVTRDVAQQILQASAASGGDHFGIPDQWWSTLQHMATRLTEEEKLQALVEEDRKRFDKQQQDKAMGQKAMDDYMASERKRREQENEENRQRVIDAQAARDAEGGANYDDGHNFGWRARIASPPASGATPAQSGRNLRPLLIGGGGILILLVLAAIVVSTGVFAGPKALPSASSSAGVRSPAASSAPQLAQASAMIGGLGEDSRNDPALVVCQLRGTVVGMEFHGTLSGPNIGSTNFDVKAGQPSHGATPTSPTDGVFAVAFPGTGGRSGGGPLGPFTCTLTSVDVPSGTQLAPHQPKEWTLTVP
jgi:hypothetical protein